MGGRGAEGVGGGCLKFHRSLELTEIYTEIKSFSVEKSFLVLSRTRTWVASFIQCCRFGAFLQYSYLSANIVQNMIKILFLQKLEKHTL